MQNELVREDSEIGNAIQIIEHENQAFELKLDVLKQILEVDALKDHHVSVVSIAGISRQGKSFLMNFFLKYLHAQYKRHDASNWIGKSMLHAFSWRNGQDSETIGIWMWPEIFTHIQPDGEKVAIILIDSQGIFDKKTGLKGCVTTFAISMLVSSVLCFNVMQDVHEDKLNHLDMFTGYGRLLMENTNENPFQQLLFVVRDWPYSDDINYGYSEEFVEELLKKKDEQTDDMHKLRERIHSSFDKIKSFLMPHPGLKVSQGNAFNGLLSNVDPAFIKYVEELAPSLFAPDKLIVKKINGKKLLPGDLVSYLRAYVMVFNSEELPQPQTVFMATATANNSSICGDCFKSYETFMRNRLDQKFQSTEPYFVDAELDRNHETAKDEAMAQFQHARKMGGDELIKPFEDKLKDDIEEKFTVFKRENEDRRNMFISSVNTELRALKTECVAEFASMMDETFRQIERYFEDDDLQKILQLAQAAALSMFDHTPKRGTVDLINEYRTQLSDTISERLVYYINTNTNRRNNTPNQRPRAEQGEEAIEQSFLRNWGPTLVGVAASFAAPAAGRAAGTAGRAIFSTIGRLFR